MNALSWGYLWRSVQELLNYCIKQERKIHENPCHLFLTFRNITSLWYSVIHNLDSWNQWASIFSKSTFFFYVRCCRCTVFSFRLFLFVFFSLKITAENFVGNFAIFILFFLVKHLTLISYRTLVLFSIYLVFIAFLFTARNP